MVDIANDNYLLKPKKAGELFKTLFQIEPLSYRMGYPTIIPTLA